jgi:predicted transcriptional regulator
MSAIELRKRLIEKIAKTENEELLSEIYRLLEMETSDIEIYKVSSDEMDAITEARDQIKNGEFLTDEEADKEIDEWLKK